MIVRIILYIMAALSFFYSFMIMRVRAGSHFYLIWSVIGVILVGLGISLKVGLFKKLPHWFNITLIAGTCVVLVLIIGIVIRLITYSENDPKDGLDYIIVLGAQIREDGPSVVLRYRLEAATEYLKRNTETKCIVSGGKGTNEIMSEAEGMKDYLVSAGIESNRIILEDKSTDTNENIKFSKILIPEGASIGLVTNDFHLYRAIFLCKKHGLENVSPIRANSDPFYRPNNYFRESLAMIKDFIF